MYLELIAVFWAGFGWIFSGTDSWELALGGFDALRFVFRTFFFFFSSCWSFSLSLDHISCFAELRKLVTGRT